MNGFVDEELRALIDIDMSANVDGRTQPLQVWVDTAFNGGLVIPRQTIARLGLKQASSTDAILADGSFVEMETFSCVLHWFGKTYRTQVVANDGHYPLLGTVLLAGRKLFIDYEQSTLTLN